MLQIPLTDVDWARVQSLFPVVSSGRGRPRRSDREILNAILWVQQTKEKWHRLPAQPSLPSLVVRTYDYDLWTGDRRSSGAKTGD